MQKKTKAEEIDNKDFFEKVYELVAQIPSGKVTTYGAIAKAIGIRSSARMVGWAMNNSHQQPRNIPAHRVVNRTGLLTGKQHFGGQDVMKELLESEGVLIENDQVLNFEEIFWNTAKNS